MVKLKHGKGTKTHHGKSLAEIKKDYCTLKPTPRVCALAHSILPVSFVGLYINY